ncbi:ABC transporter permease [bacterium]|nr:ABC transporter permease [bacterium]MBU1152691.1 ABC transporter permease [bacterium]MBU2599478.1 ABC transporter permease [bacterium]
MNLIIQIGNKILESLKNINQIIQLLVDAVISLFYLQKSSLRANMNVLFSQIRFTGINALPLVNKLALLLGIVVIIQAATYLPKIGASDYIGSIITLVIIRELGPLMVAFIVIGRSGTAIATELCSMKINHEINALEVMGINPYQFIIIPRLLGVAISVFCLVVYFDVIALGGGYLVSYLKIKLPLIAFMSGLKQSLALKDLILSGVKGLLFGFTIATIGCYQGLIIKGSLTEIPQAATKTVVRSISTIFFFNSLLAFIFYYS